jgi:hypothetical protein
MRLTHNSHPPSRQAGPISKDSALLSTAFTLWKETLHA